MAITPGIIHSPPVPVQLGYARLNHATPGTLGKWFMTESAEPSGAIWPTAKGRPPAADSGRRPLRRYRAGTGRAPGGRRAGTGRAPGGDRAPGGHVVVPHEPPVAGTARLLVGTGSDWRSCRCERAARPMYWPPKVRMSNRPPSSNHFLSHPIWPRKVRANLSGPRKVKPFCETVTVIPAKPGLVATVHICRSKHLKCHSALDHRS